MGNRWRFKQAVNVAICQDLCTWLCCVLCRTCRWLHSSFIWIWRELWGWPHACPTVSPRWPSSQPSHVLRAAALQDYQLSLVGFCPTCTFNWQLIRGGLTPLLLVSAYFRGSWKRCLLHGEPDVPSVEEKTWLTASSAPPYSFASCARPSCPHLCSTSCRSIPQSGRHGRSRSSPRWCRTWPASASEYLSVAAQLHQPQRPFISGACTFDIQCINCSSPTVST